jgi:hypothetical protein
MLIAEYIDAAQALRASAHTGEPSPPRQARDIHSIAVVHLCLTAKALAVRNRPLYIRTVCVLIYVHYIYRSASVHYHRAVQASCVRYEMLLYTVTYTATADLQTCISH